MYQQDSLGRLSPYKVTQDINGINITLIIQS